MKALLFQPAKRSLLFKTSTRKKRGRNLRDELLFNSLAKLEVLINSMNKLFFFSTVNNPFDKKNIFCL